MQAKVFIKISLTVIFLLGTVVFLLAGPNPVKKNEISTAFEMSKVMTDFKLIIAKDLAQMGFAVDLGLTALNKEQIVLKNAMVSPPPPPIVVTTIEDTYIRQDKEENNYGGRNLMEVEYHVGADHDRRGLIKIDLSAYNCVIVESATLYMYLEDDENEGVIIDAFAVTSQWNEGNEDGDDGVANWEERSNGVNWTTNGGDFDPALLGTMTTEVQGYRPLTLDVSTVQAWINDPANNNGLILMGRLDNSKRPKFTTMEGTAARRPYLELNLREACCSNGVDDDGDGNIDNMDGDCGGYSAVSTDTPISIPDDATSTITSTITVEEFGIVTDINVLALDILHNYIGDISITLTSPSGTVVELRDNGCTSNDNLYLNFDDMGLPYSAIGCPPVDVLNVYQAFGNLNDFNGEEVHGDWILTVDDNFAEDGGTFLSWTLQYFLGTSTGRCGNGLDEDGDGFTDGTDPDCDCGTNNELVAINGSGMNTTGSIGIDNVGNATGNADGAFAQVYDGDDLLVIELTDVLSENTEYTLTWRRKSSYTNTATADIVVEESMDGTNWTTNPTVPNTTNRVSFVTSNIFTNIETKFIRLREQTVSNDDFDFDAVSYDTETCQLIAFEICGNGMDDDNDGLIDNEDPDCGDCAACFTPIVSEFLIPFPEDQVLTALETIFPSVANCNFDVPVPTAPIYSYVSVSAFLDGTIIFYDHWEDGFEAEASNPIQSTTEIWGDGNLSNGFPPNHPTDIIDAGAILILNNPIDPTTLQSVIDFDGGDAISSSFPLSVTRAAWAEGTETLLAGALEVFSTESWGTNYIVPVGTDVDTIYQYFDYTGVVIMAAENNTSVNIDADANGTFETNIILNKGESYQINGTILSGAEIDADKKIQVDIITGDICDHYESRWFLLPPREQWEDNYYSPISGTDQVYQVYNPNNAAITVKRRTNSGLISDIVIPANSTGRFSGTEETGYHLYTEDASAFYPIVLYNANTGTGNTGDLINSTADWGAALIPYSRLTQQVVVGWAPGQDPTFAQSENGSPVWVTAFYPPGSPDAGSGPITVCVDYDGDNSGLLTDSYGRNYDASFTIDELDDLQVYDPDGNQTNMVLYVCDDKEALLSVMWGQENGVASGASPGLDVGTGVPGLNPFFAYKTVALTGDVDNDGAFSLGDTIQYSIGIQNPGLVPVSGNYLIEDIFPDNLNYIQNSTSIDDGTNQMTIVDAGSSDFPLDEGGVTLGIALEPRAEAVVSFSTRIISIPSDSLITNYATVTKDGIKYEPKVTIKVHPVSEICGNFIDDDFDGFTDCDCETEDNVIRGIVFNDNNKNSVNDAEDGISQVTVNVYNDVNGDGVIDSGDTQFDSATTTAEGAYEFSVSGTKLEKRIAATDDDAEQDNSIFLAGGTTTNNADLDLGFGYEGGFDKTIVGLRYPDINIPSGAVITNAYIEFTANSSESGGCNMDIYIEANDNASAYQSTFQNLSNRTVYNSLVDWNGVSNWTNNQTYQTPDLSSIVQLVIDRAGWNSGQSLSFLIQGTDRREAFSFEDDPNKAPKLVVNYAFFPANYIVEIDTNSVQTISAGAEFTTPTTQAIIFGDSEAFVCEANFGVAFNEVCDDGIDNDFDGLTDCDDPDCTTPSLTFNGNTTVCGGESTTITAVGNEDNYDYEWSNGLGSGQTKTITPPSDPTQNLTTTYMVTVTNAVGCTAVGTIGVTAESLPAVMVSFSDEFCNQSNGFIVFTFSDHPNQTQLNFSIDGGNTYPHTVQDNNGTFAVGNLSAGLYDPRIRWGDEECPVNLPDITIGNASGPSVDITGPNSVCEGESAQIIAQATSGNSPYLYTWDNGLGNGSTKTVFPDTTTIYNVTATDNKGCTDTDQIQITALSSTHPDCSDCPNPADNDGDGVCESEDCDDDDPNIPALPGTACDDGNPNSINDQIQADECSCVGEFLPCSINFGVQIDQPLYNNNGTDNNFSDDTFTFTVLINGNGSAWTADGQSGVYGTSATFGPYPVDANGISFDVIDTDNPNCRENISVNIASCIYSGVCTCCE